MNKLISAFIFLFALISCTNNSEKKETVSNDLISKNVIANYEFDGYPFSPKWISTFDTNFITPIINNALNKKITIFNDDLNDTLSINDIKQDLGLLTDTQLVEQEDGSFKMILKNSDFDEKSIKTIFFNEEWFYNNQKNIFNKKIISYSPVKYYHKFDTLKYTRKKVLTIKNDNFNEKNSKQIAKNIIYEVDFNNDTSTTVINGLDINNFVNVLVENALNKKTKCYDSFSAKQMNVNEIKKELGQTIDTILTEDPETGEIITKISKNDFDKSEIKGITFIENWYLDTISFNIQKQVVGIAPIRFIEKYYEDETEPEISKTIPFVNYFTSEKPKIF